MEKVEEWLQEGQIQTKIRKPPFGKGGGGGGKEEKEEGEEEEEDEEKKRRKKKKKKNKKSFRHNLKGEKSHDSCLV